MTRRALLAGLASMTLTQAGSALAEGASIVIVREDEIPVLADFCDRPSILYDGTWALGSSDVGALEDRLARQPDLLRICAFRRDPEIDTWYRMYGGLLVGGKRVILAKYYTKESIAFFRQFLGDKPFVICDSHAGWLWFLYDVDAETVIDPDPPGVHFLAARDPKTGVAGCPDPAGKDKAQDGSGPRPSR